MSRLPSILLLTTFLLTPLSLLAAYELIEPPVATDTSDAVQIVDVFWYGCEHCWAFLPMMEKFLEDQGDKVDIMRMPGLIQKHWEIHARLFFTLQILGREVELHRKVYERIHEQGDDLDSYQKIRAFAVANGVVRSVFQDLFNSEQVDKLLAAALEKHASYQVAGTPTLIVNGRYRIDGVSAGSLEGMIKELTQLLPKLTSNQ